MQKTILSHHTSLHLTASLKEAISLLQLSNYELFEKILSLSETNPFIRLSPLENAQIGQTTSLDDSINYTDYSEESFQSYLKKELMLSPLSREIQEVTLRLIDHCDEKGFFDPHQFFHLPLQVQQLIDLWLKKLEPIGLGARSIYECLIWQVEAQIMHRPDLRTLMLVLDKLHQGWSFSSLSKSDLESIRHTLEQYDYHFYFYPSSLFSYRNTENIEWIDLIAKWDREKQRFFVERHEDYKWTFQVESWPENLSKKHSLRKSYQEAIGLEKMISIRNTSLIKTAQYLCDYQKDFLIYGPEYIKPIILKDLHEKMNLHESTLSRLLDKKTILTKNGLIPIKNMLSKPIKSLVNHQKSQESIRHMILEYLNAENLQDPYSDEEITRMLRSQGIDIARRTVSKYREDLGVLNSHQRKKN